MRSDLETLLLVSSRGETAWVFPRIVRSARLAAAAAHAGSLGRSFALRVARSPGAGFTWAAAASLAPPSRYGAPSTALIVTPLFVWSAVMEIEYRTRFTCLWCGTAFNRRSHTGRKPSYCCSSHRQRSYEARRRDLHRSHHPAPPPSTDRRDPRSLSPKDYPAGHHFDGRIGSVIHALRGDGPPNLAGHHLTLCGTWARHTSRPYRWAVRNGMGHHHRCATCLALAAQFPAPHSTDHFEALATLRSQLARQRDRREEPWLRPLIDACFPPAHALAS